MGFELVLSIVLGYWVGHWLDVRFAHDAGWVTAVGTIVGVYAGFRALFIAAAKMQRDIERAEAEERRDRGSTSGSAGTTNGAPHDDDDHAA